VRFPSVWSEASPSPADRFYRDLAVCLELAPKTVSLMAMAALALAGEQVARTGTEGPTGRGPAGCDTEAQGGAVMFGLMPLPAVV
jgi:hypothetical protein